MGYEGTLIGPDGKRYPRGAVPAAVEASPRMDGRIYGTPLEGSVVVWSITRRRWEWSIPAAQGNVVAATGAAQWNPATGTIAVAVDAAANVASARTLGTGATQAAPGGALAAIGAIAATQGEPMGFADRTGSTVAVSVGADDLTVTISPTGASFDVWVQGQKFTKTGPESVTFAKATGPHHIAYDPAGTLQVSIPSFDLGTEAPVTLVYWSATAAAALVFEERHGLTMDWATHRYLHSTVGTRYVSGLTLGNYTVAPSSPTNTHNTFSIGSGRIADEDLVHDLPGVTAGGPYTVYHRVGAGEWTWQSGLAVPYVTSGPTIAYNRFNAGSYDLAAVSTNNYVNLWVISAPGLGGHQHGVIAGQTQHANLASAQAEVVETALNLTDLPWAEAVIRYRVTMRVSAGYSTTGKCRIEAVQQLIGTSIAIANQLAVTSHTVLSGRDALDQHPASAITFTPPPSMRTTDVQAAIEELLPFDAGLPRSIHDPTGGSDTVTTGTNNRGLYLLGYGTATGVTGLFLVAGVVPAGTTATIAVYDPDGTDGAPGTRTAVSAATAITSNAATKIPFSVPADIRQGDYLFVSVSEGAAYLAGHSIAGGILDYVTPPPIQAPWYFEDLAVPPPLTAAPTNAQIPVPMLIAYT